MRIDSDILIVICAWYLVDTGILEYPLHSPIAAEQAVQQGQKHRAESQPNAEQRKVGLANDVSSCAPCTTCQLVCVIPSSAEHARHITPCAVTAAILTCGSAGASALLLYCVYASYMPAGAAAAVLVPLPAPQPPAMGAYLTTLLRVWFIATPRGSEVGLAMDSSTMPSLKSLLCRVRFGTRCDLM